MVFIGAVFVASFVFGGDSHGKPKFKHVELLNYGSCRYVNGMVDLSEVLYLQNTSLNHFGDNASKKLSLNGGEVIVQTGEDGRKLVFSITEFIEENYKLINPDIDLSFVIVKNELSIYWKETFLHRTYRQGIVRIQKNSIVAMCDGVGGVESSH